MKPFFKLRHGPSGLFYKPSKHRSPSNLSKDGKTYSKRPSLKNLGGMFTHPDDAQRWGVRKFRPVIPSEWELVQYDVVETSRETLS